MPSVEAKFASIGMVLIKGNKWAFRRPLEKVRITTYDTSQTTMVGERERHMHTYTHRDRHKNNHTNKKKYPPPPPLNIIREN